MVFNVVGPGIALVAIGAVLTVVLGSLLPFVIAIVLALVFGWARR